MFTNITRCPSSDRVAGYSPTNPITGSSVSFPSPPTVNYHPYWCNVMDFMFDYEVLSEELDLAYLTLNKADSEIGCGRLDEIYGQLYTDPYVIQDYMGRLQSSEYLHNLAMFFTRRWDEFGREMVTNIKGENPVIHNNLFGRVRSDMQGPLLRRPIGAYEGGHVGQHQFEVVSAVPFLITLSDDSAMVPKGNLGSILPTLQSLVNAGDYNVDGSPISTRYSDFTYTLNEFGGGTVGYYYTVQNDNVGSNRRYINQFAIRLTVSIVPLRAVNPLDNIFTFKELVDYTFSYEWDFTHGYWHTPISGGTPPWNHTIDTFLDTYYSSFPGLYESWSSRPYAFELAYDGEVVCATYNEHKSVYNLIGYDSDVDRFVSTAENTQQHFAHLSDNITKECMPLVFLSYKDAVEKHFNFMSSNHLEALSELTDILRPVDSVILFKSLPSFISKKGVLVLKVLDLITDAYLTWRLGIAPTISDAEDVSRKARTFKSRILSGEVFAAQATSNGKFEIDLEAGDLPGAPECKVIVRTKLRIEPVLDSLLASVITTDSLGLLPKLSTMWDLIPFSFVLDWFTSAGTSADLIESQIKLLALDMVYHTSSIQVVREFTDQEQLDYHFEIVPGDDAEVGAAGYKKYVRFVSRDVPILGPSRISYLPEPGIPDWFTAGSLLYKKL